MRELKIKNNLLGLRKILLLDKAIKENEVFAFKLSSRENDTSIN